MNTKKNCVQQRLWKKDRRGMIEECGRKRSVMKNNIFYMPCVCWISLSSLFLYFSLLPFCIFKVYIFQFYSILIYSFLFSTYHITQKNPPIQQFYIVAKKNKKKNSNVVSEWVVEFFFCISIVLLCILFGGTKKCFKIF